MADVKLEKTLCDRELIEKILAILEKHEKLLPQFLSADERQRNQRRTGV